MTGEKAPLPIDRKDLPTSDPIGHSEGIDERNTLQQFLNGIEFQNAYGCSRAYYHLYGDRYPVDFLHEYSHPASQYHIEERTQALALLEEIRKAYRLQVAYWIVPFAAEKNKSGYEFAIGHKTNNIGWGSIEDLCRGLMISLTGVNKHITILQMDPDRNRGFFDHDSDPDKRQFFSVMLNLLLRDGLNVDKPFDVTVGENIQHRILVATDETFTIEKIARLYHKSYKNFDVIY